MEQERPPYLSQKSDKLLQLLAKYAPEESDDVVIETFISQKVLPKYMEGFRMYEKDRQYAIALFDRLPKDVLLDIKRNRKEYYPQKPENFGDDEKSKLYLIGAHDIAGTLHRLEILTGKIEDR